MFESISPISLKVFLTRFSRREYLAFCLLAIGVFTSLYGFWLLFKTGSPGFSEPVVASSQGFVDEQSELDRPQIIVEAAGAVNSPGVYSVPIGARIGEVLEKAGGISKSADSRFVAKDLQLAQSVNDGQKIYIPMEGELPSLTQNNEAIDSGPSSSGGQANKTQGNSGVSINNASSKELQTLKGIGQARAEAIINARPYSKIDDLLENGILSEGIFKSIENEITL